MRGADVLLRLLAGAHSARRPVFHRAVHLLALCQDLLSLHIPLVAGACALLAEKYESSPQQVRLTAGAVCVGLGIAATPGSRAVLLSAETEVWRHVAHRFPDTPLCFLSSSELAPAQMDVACEWVTAFLFADALASALPIQLARVAMDASRGMRVSARRLPLFERALLEADRTLPGHCARLLLPCEKRSHSAPGWARVGRRMRRRGTCVEWTIAGWLAQEDAVLILLENGDGAVLLSSASLLSPEHARIDAGTRKRTRELEEKEEAA